MSKNTNQDDALGVAGAELAEGGLVPTTTEFRAITLITYGMPLVRPVIVYEVAVIRGAEDGGIDLCHVSPLLLEYLMIYSAIAEPPVFAGAVHVTARLALPLVATTAVGLLGTVARGVVGAEFADGGPISTAFLAITLITYGVPLVNPVMVTDSTVDADRTNVVNFAPLLLEYFTT